MFDHVTIRVADRAASQRFYDSCSRRSASGRRRGRRLHRMGRLLDRAGGDGEVVTTGQFKGASGSFSVLRDDRGGPQRAPGVPGAVRRRDRRFHGAAVAPATATTAAPASGRSTTRATRARSCSTPTPTTSKSSTTTADVLPSLARLFEEHAVGGPISAVSRWTPRTLEAYLRRAAGPAGWIGSARSRRSPRTRGPGCGARGVRSRPSARATRAAGGRWRAVAEAWDFEAVNRLIGQHNDWFPSSATSRWTRAPRTT